MSFAFSANPIDPSTNYLQGKTLSGYPTASNPTYVGTYAEESLLINKAISNPQSQPSAFGDGSGGSLEIVPGQPGNSVVALSTFNDVYAKTTLNVQGGPLQVGIPGVEDTVTIKPGAAGSGQVTIDASSSEVDNDVSIVIEPKGSGAVTIGNTLFQDSISILPNPVGFNNVTLNAVGPDSNITYTIAPKGTGAINLGQRSNTNAIQVVPGQTGSNAAQINAVGQDTNIDIQIQPKQGGVVTLGNQQSHDAISVVPGASAVNINAVGPDTTIHQNIIPKGIGSVTIGNSTQGDALQIQPNAAGQNVVKLNAVGADSSIAMTLQPKGASTINLGDPTAATNGVQIQTSGAGAGFANIYAVGPDAAINLNISSKGAGVVTMPSAQINGNLNCMSSAIIQPGHSWGGSTFPTMLVWAVLDLYCVSSTSTGVGTGQAIFGGTPDPGNHFSTGAAGNLWAGSTGTPNISPNYTLVHNAGGLSALHVPICMGGNAVSNHYFTDTSGDFASQPPSRFRLIVRGIITNQTATDGAYTVPLCVIEDTAAAQDTAHILKSWTHNCTNTNRGLATSISPWMSLASAYTVYLNLYTNATSNDFSPLAIYAQYGQ